MNNNVSICHYNNSVIEQFRFTISFILPGLNAGLSIIRITIFTLIP